MSCPISISAVESNDLSILFFNSDNLQITSLTAQQTRTRDDTDYNITGVTFRGGKRVNVKAPQLSAVAYLKDGHHEISSSKSIAANVVQSLTGITGSYLLHWQRKGWRCGLHPEGTLPDRRWRVVCRQPRPQCLVSRPRLAAFGERRMGPRGFEGLLPAWSK